MNCPNCGYLNAEGTTVCASCGQILAQPPAPPMPPAPPAPPTAPEMPAGYAPAPQGYAPPPAPAGYAAPPQPAYAQPPAYGQVQQPAAPVKNHLVMAIISTVLCCVPVGIVSIIFAIQVNSKLAAGDFAGAQSASKNALIWAWVAIGAGALAGIAYAVLMIISIAAESGSF